MKIKFNEVTEGAIFTKEGIEFKKIPLVQISCCRSINAEQTANASERIFVSPSDEVEVND